MTYTGSVNHSTGVEPDLAVYAGWWGLIGVGENGQEWTLEEKFSQLASEGFAGILLFGMPEASDRAHWVELLDSHDLRLGLGTFTADSDELKREVDDAMELGITYVNCQVRDDFTRRQAAVDLLGRFVGVGEAAGVPVLIETHRATITQDLLRTLDYIEALPHMQVAADLSHYVVAGQMQQVTGDFGPFPADLEAAMTTVVDRAASVHGRVSNGHQVQVDIGNGTDDLPAAHFARWWKRGFSSWRERAAPGDVFTFVTELGPPPYSIITRGPGSAFSREISDRWEQTLVFKRLAETLWAETTAEAEAAS